MFYIFGTREEAQRYVDNVDAALGYPKAGVPADDKYGWTTTWATPRQHPSGSPWAVPVAQTEISMPIPDGAHVVEELDQGWSPVHVWE